MLTSIIYPKKKSVKLLLQISTKQSYTSARTYIRMKKNLNVQFQKISAKMEFLEVGEGGEMGVQIIILLYIIFPAGIRIFSTTTQ